MSSNIYYKIVNNLNAHRKCIYGKYNLFIVLNNILTTYGCSMLLQ